MASVFAIVQSLSLPSYTNSTEILLRITTGGYKWARGTNYMSFASNPNAIKFESEVKTVPLGNGTIRIENLTPIFSQKEREKRKREVETQLFDVFSK